jgi:hypothetical protein
MRIDLYPADDESTNPRQDFLDLLRQNDSPPLEVTPLRSPSGQIRVGGNMDLVVNRIQEWLGQRPGRAATPPSVGWEQHLLGNGEVVFIAVHP